MSSAPSNTDQHAGEETGGTAHRYTARLAGDIEARWQQYWASHQTFLTPNPGMPGWDGDKPKFYCLDMFPYPSSAGLHVGHPEGYTATDIISRYKRMRGHNVLHPMGWDAFGLPAEQYAIKTGVHPAKTTRESIDNFRRQLQRFGFSYDWSREFGTIDEGYYKWTQWIFLRLYNAWFDPEQNKARHIDELIAMFERGDRPVRFNQEAAELDSNTRGRDLKAWGELDEATRHAVLASYRLAYIGEQTVNWCPALGTALANEEVIDGRSERGSHPVVRKPLKQWMLRITAYAERLLDGLAGVDWPESTKTQQTEWIGRSVGAHIDFEAGKRRIRVFTTRPDTVFGATYMVLAPEHPMVDELLGEKYGDTVPKAWIGGGFDDAEDLVARNATPRELVDAYRSYAAGRSDLERQAESKTKSGVFIGAYALNPASGERVPVFIADYVLMGYGTGAIMAVPAHDQRDFEFAQVFELPIRDVAYPRLYQAMHFYAEHIADEERADDERWRGVLADFLGITTSRDGDPESFAELLAQVRKPRVEQGEAPEWRREFIEGAQLDAVGGTGLRRGSVKITWLDAIEGLGFKDAEDFVTTFEHGGLYTKLGEAMPGVGRMVNSTGEGVSLDGLTVDEAKARIVEHLEVVGRGEAKVNYRLRDWLFSRQRYWGEPFPIVYDEQGLHRAVSADALPVTLPDLADYTPEVSDDPKPLLAKATEWINTRAGIAGVEGLASDAPVTREANTMPGWAGSCWYYLRYCDPHNDERLVGEEAERAWMGENGVDLYIGGAEHAVLHLLYARFWHMALYDLGEVGSPEPFRKLFHQGLITSYAYARPDKTLVPVDEVEERADGTFVETATGNSCTQTTAKMSKSLKNVVNPDDVIAEFGADTFRLYEMYLGPLEQSKPWNTRDMVGMQRFLQRAWRLTVDEETGEGVFLEEANPETEKALHRTIAKVGGDIERLAFNTGISAMIEFVNGATSAKPSGLTRDQASRFALILCPFAPHIAEELWGIAGNGPVCSLHPWPAYDEAMLTDDEVEIAVQIMGKTRAKLMVPADAAPKAIEDMAMSDDAVKALIDGKTVRKVIVVPGRLINIVAN